MLEQIAKSLRVAQALEERFEREVVESAGIALQAQRDDAIPLRLLTAGALAQHFGVVDLADLEMRSAAADPRAADPALGEQILWSTGEQQKQRQSSASASRWMVNSPIRRSCNSAASSPIAGSGRTGASPSMASMSGCTLHTTRPSLVRRPEAETRREREPPMAGCAPG